MELLTMSRKEIDQVSIFEKLKNKGIKQSDAAKMLDLSVRQVKRKIKDYRRIGAKCLIHGNRGKTGNRRIDEEKAKLAIELIKEKYSDFGPTLAAEKLLEIHSLEFDHETLRRLMTKEGLWKVKIVRTITKHFWRERKPCFGEMVQLDGSPHDWFEGRAEKCTLIAFIDDATSQILWLEFAKSESVESLMKSTRSYIETYGKPASFYADRGSVYKVNKNNPDNDKITQYGRAMNEIHVKLINARSPEAKGRVENLFGTLQDRLVKELRLANISSIEEANKFARGIYIPKHNAKFAVKPKSEINLHEPIDGYDLDNTFCIKENRQVNKDHTINYKARFFQLEDKQATIVRPKNIVTINESLNGSIEIYLRKTKLNFKELPTRPEKQNKPIELKERKTHTPQANHPWRKQYFKRDISIELAR